MSNESKQSLASSISKLVDEMLSSVSLIEYQLNKLNLLEDETKKN